MVSSWKQYCINESTEQGKGREEKAETEKGVSIFQHGLWGEKALFSCLCTYKSQNIQSMFVKITFDTALEMLIHLTLNRKLKKLSEK